MGNYITDLETAIKNMGNVLSQTKKEIVATINQDFLKILKEAKKTENWYKAGRCYKCGGTVKCDNNLGLWSSVHCEHCGKELYADAFYEYYYAPLIEKLLKLADKMLL